MPLETLVALMGFALVMSISPGPANFLLLASGANFGFARSIPLILGISSGFLTMVFCVGIGLGQVLQGAPEIYVAVKIACAAYVFWLAWKIGTSRSVDGGKTDRSARPISLPQAAAFQLVNPKAWAVALIVTVSYTDPGNYVPSLILMIAVFAMVNLPSISVWAIFGVALRRVLGEGRRIAVFNIVMALLLIGSMIPVLLGSST